jgi:hypothetical protein
MSSPAGTLGSWVRIPLEGMDVCVYSVFVSSCVGSGLASGWSPFQEILPTLSRLRHWNETKSFADALSSKWQQQNHIDIYIRPHRSLKVAVQGPDFWPTPSTYIHIYDPAKSLCRQNAVIWLQAGGTYSNHRASKVLGHGVFGASFTLRFPHIWAIFAYKSQRQNSRLHSNLTQSYKTNTLLYLFPFSSSSRQTENNRRRLCLMNYWRTYRPHATPFTSP